MVVFSKLRVFVLVFFLDFGAKNPKKPHFWIFFFGPQVGFYRVWMGFGVLTNGFWIVFISFYVTGVIKLLVRELARG